MRPAYQIVPHHSAMDVNMSAAQADYTTPTSVMLKSVMVRVTMLMRWSMVQLSLSSSADRSLTVTECVTC